MNNVVNNNLKLNNLPDEIIFHDAEKVQRAVFLKVSAVGIATIAFLMLQMQRTFAVACTIAGVVSSITLLSEYFLRRDDSFPNTTSNWFSTESMNGKQLFAFVGSMLVASMLAGFIFSRMKFSVGQHVQELIKKGGTRIVVLATVVAPICEEILFRGFLKERFEDACYLFSRFIHPLSNTTVKKISNACQAIIFGAVHMNGKQTFKANALIFVVTTYIGSWVGGIKDRESTLITPIGYHMGLNTSVVVRLLTFGY